METVLIPGIAELINAVGSLATAVIAVIVWRFDRRLYKLELTVGMNQALAAQVAASVQAGVVAPALVEAAKAAAEENS